MPLPGGATDKIGNRYELWWTLYCATDVMGEKADAIHLEPPDDTGDGVEFILTRGQTLEYHQVKRQNSRPGHWPLELLETKKVLSRFWDKIKSDGNTQCHFVSTLAASELQELSENARSSDDVKTFMTGFIAKGDRKRHFTRLTQSWNNCSHEDAYQGLRRIYVRTKDELSLRDDVQSKLEALVDGPPSTVAGLLGQFLLDNVHHKLRSIDIWNFLSSTGIYRRQWNNDPHVLTAVDAQNNRYLEPLVREAILGDVIPRREVSSIIAVLESPNSKQGVMISGEAGIGKSGIAGQVINEIKLRNWPVVAFRVDQLTTMQTPHDVGSQLGLPESPVTVLANIAQSQPCLLVIDQLDATSKASGRNAHFFNCIAELIRQVEAHTAMRVLLFCRKFDIINDDRLRKLIGEHGFAQEIPISKLDQDTVRDVVSRLGLASKALNSQQIDLLAIPLHLKLLSEVADNDDISELNFFSANDLFRTYWEHKRRLIEQRVGRNISWSQIIYKLCDHMSDTQRLYAPKAIVDEYEADAEVLASEHVLIVDKFNYRFFHEAFFDYAFARHFSSTGSRLISLMLKGEQHLFRRAQVRQILAYRREADFESYLLDLREILYEPTIRYHLKQVVFAVLRQLSTPTEQEWDIIAPLLENPENPLYSEAWSLGSQPAWFCLAVSEGIVWKWLEGDETQINQTVRWLAIIVREVPEDVAALMDNWDTSVESWYGRLMLVLSAADLSKSRHLFDLFLRVLKQETLASMRLPITSTINFWEFIYGLAEAEPDWYCEALGAYLNHHLVFNMERGVNNPFAPRNALKIQSTASDVEDYEATLPTGTIEDTQFGHQIIEVAQKSPITFAANVFDFVLKVAEQNAVHEGTPPHKDKVWPLRNSGNVHGIAESILKGTEIALELISASIPELLGPYAEQLQASDTETAQYLLIRAFTANGKQFADDAVEYLCENPARFETNWSDGNQCASRLLLEAVSPHCSEGHLNLLEGALIGYYIPYEVSAASYRKGHGTRAGYCQLILLNGIEPSRRSRQVMFRLEQWRRKFLLKDIDQAPVLSPFVTSQLPNEALHKMTDKQWLLAIAKYNSDNSLWDRAGIGGPHQVSQQLEALTKLQPARFADLLLKFPSTTHLAYFEAVLRGLGEANDDVEIAIKACRLCHELPGRPCGNWICNPIKRLAGQKIPNELLDIVAWYATESPDPSCNDGTRNAVKNEEELSYFGINTVRGSASRAMSDLIFGDISLAHYFADALERMVQDPSLMVRSCVVSAVTAVLNADRDMAIRLFMKLVQGTDDVLLATHGVVEFLYYGLYTHLGDLTPILHRMLASNNAAVAEAGAIRACLVALSQEDAIPLAQLAINGSEAHRKGAAAIFAENISLVGYQTLLQETLRAFFNDESTDVRRLASQCFDKMKSDDLQNVHDLIEAFIKSPAFAEYPGPLIRALEATTAKLPDVTCNLCERFFVSTGNEANDMRAAVGVIANNLGKLVVRTYEQSSDPKIRTRCLDIIDIMAQKSAHWMLEALSQLDR